MRKTTTQIKTQQLEPLINRITHNMARVRKARSLPPATLEKWKPQFEAVISDTSDAVNEFKSQLFFASMLPNIGTDWYALQARVDELCSSDEWDSIVDGVSRAVRSGNERALWQELSRFRSRMIDQVKDCGVVDDQAIAFWFEGITK